jgi:hypothetical protein
MSGAITTIRMTPTLLELLHVLEESGITMRELRGSRHTGE